MGEVRFKVFAVAQVDRADANAIVEADPAASVTYGPDAGVHTVTEVSTKECATLEEAQSLLEKHLVTAGLAVKVAADGKMTAEREAKDVTPEEAAAVPQLVVDNEAAK